jgi:hypothetical protein
LEAQEILIVRDNEDNDLLPKIMELGESEEEEISKTLEAVKS